VPVSAPFRSGDEPVNTRPLDSGVLVQPPEESGVCPVIASNGDNVKAGDCIYDGRDTIEALAVHKSAEKTMLVVKGLSERTN
jgi:hypothetical protein